MPGMVIQISGDSKHAQQALKEVSLQLKDQQAILKNLQREYAALSTAQARGIGGKAIAADIRIAKEEIARLGAVSTSSFGAVGAGAGKAFSALRQFAYIIPGIGIAGLVGGLSELVVGLLSGAGGFDKISLAAGHFDNDLKKLKQSLSDFKDNLDFEGKLEKLALELQGLSGIKLSAAQGAVDIQQNAKYITELSGSIQKLSDQNANLVKTRTEFEKTFFTISGGSTKLAKLIIQFGQVGDLPDAAVKQLKKGDQELVRQYQKTSDEIKALQKKRTEATQNVILGVTGLVKPKAEDKVKVTKAVENFILDMNLKVPIHPDFLIDVKRIKFILLGGTTQTFAEKVTENINKEIQKLASAKPLDAFSIQFALNEEKLAVIRDQLLELQRMGEFVGQGLANAFGTAFDKIADGENAFKAVGEAIKDLVIQMIKAAIQAFIVKKVLALIGGGPVGLLSSFALGGNAAGGAVSAHQPRVIGESGPEIFVPSTSGSIIPNNQIPGMGSGTQRIQVEVIGRLQMREIVLGVARELQYQGANA